MSPDNNDVQLVEQLNKKVTEIKSEIAKVIVGQDEIINQLIISLLSRGHCLLVGVPGLAKTLLIKTLAEVMDLKFNRIQFTPDLMPSDITGTEILEEDLATKKETLDLYPVQSLQILSLQMRLTELLLKLKQLC
ncbi:MAG: AAA family ATPase [Ignavibacteriales bacterium]|nr:AAA family ATPase [Ignavibacteriales bacterium]